MAIYKYRAKNGATEIVEGKIEAQSDKEAIEKVSQLGYLPVRIEQDGARTDSNVSLVNKPMPRPPGKIKSREITVISRQLASLLRSGVPILTALNIISEQSESYSLKQILTDINSAIKDGATFSSVLAKYPSVFSSLYIALVRTGEDGGALPEALLRIADYRAKQEEMLSRFRMALAYPVLMATVGLATIVFMLTFVMPRMMKIFVNLGQDLPLPTKILISTSNALRHPWPWVFLVLFILVARRESKSEKARVPLSLLKLRLPVFGKFILKVELGRFARTLELLIKNGIPILRAMEIATPVLENEILKKRLVQSYKDLEQGGSLGKSLKNAKVFPLFMSNLISVGEESGRLDEALSEVATSYERDTDEAIRVMGNLIEPLMILGVGLIVGFMVIAMLLPIFEINVMAR